MALPIQIVFKVIEDSAVVGNRIYPTQAPQNTNVSTPYVVLNTISTTPTNTKKEASTLDRVRIQVSIFGNSYQTISENAESIRDYIGNLINRDILSDGTILQCSTFEGQVDGIDSGAGLDGVYYIHQDYYFWITR